AGSRGDPGAGPPGPGDDREGGRCPRRDALARRVRAVRAGPGEGGGQAMSVAELPGTMLAPAKLNLCLYVGPTREDGLHEIRSLFEPLELADELKLNAADSDEVVLEGI